MPDPPLSEKADLGVKSRLSDLELVLNFTSHSGQTGCVTTLWTFAYAGPGWSASLPWALPCHPQRSFQRLPLL